MKNASRKLRGTYARSVEDIRLKPGIYVGPDFIGTVRLQTGPTFWSKSKNLRTHRVRRRKFDI